MYMYTWQTILWVGCCLPRCLFYSPTQHGQNWCCILCMTLPTHKRRKDINSIPFFAFLQRKGHCSGSQYCKVFGNPFHTPLTCKKWSSSTASFNVRRSPICLSCMACQSFLGEAQDCPSSGWPTKISYKRTEGTPCGFTITVILFYVHMLFAGCDLRRQAEGSIFKPAVTVFHYTDRP